MEIGDLVKFKVRFGAQSKQEYEKEGTVFKILKNNNIIIKSNYGSFHNRKIKEVQFPNEDISEWYFRT